MGNPNIPTSMASAKTAVVDQHGSAIRRDGATRKPWESGTVLDYFPNQHAYRVQGSRSGILEYVPRLINDPGETSVLPRGTLVAVHHELGYPVIDKVIPAATLQSVNLNPTQLSEVQGVGGNDSVYQSAEGANYCPPGAPVDAISGDWIRRSPDGNHVGALAGGMNVMHSGPMAQIRTHQLDDLVEILSHNFKHITSMGDMNIVNEEGKTSLVWRAGSDQSNENGANRGNWTIRLDIGARPAGDLFTFEVTTPEGQSLCKVHMSSNGRLELLGAAGLDFTSGDRGPMRTDVGGDQETDIRGDQVESIQGDVTRSIGGSRLTETSKDDNLIVGNSLAETINTDRNTYVGGVIKQKVQGGLPLPPASVGFLAGAYEFINGGVETVIASPLSGGVPTAQQTCNYVNYAGGFNFVIQPTSLNPKFNIVSMMPDSVLLGANGAAIPSADGTAHTVTAIAPFHVMKYEPFEAMMTILLKWLNMHTHLGAMGPTGPAQMGATGPVDLMVAPPVVQIIKSLRVAVGL